MKNIKIILLSIVVLGFTNLVHAKAEINSEYQAVVDTAYRYFNGAATGDQALLAKAFDMEFGHIKMNIIDKVSGKETIRSLTLKEFSAFFKKATVDSWQAKILSVDIVDDKMAMVKLDFDTPKTHYVDYLVMYKREGQWKIINKTFVSTKK
ncbi:MAG: hypothetical protein ACI9LM_001667 [Alteromonadaceae bacterium]|jgi:hypothetical protein